jgi:hypothetical protein
VSVSDEPPEISLEQAHQRLRPFPQIQRVHRGRPVDIEFSVLEAEAVRVVRNRRRLRIEADDDAVELAAQRVPSHRVARNVGQSRDQGIEDRVAEVLRPHVAIRLAADGDLLPPHVDQHLEPGRAVVGTSIEGHGSVWKAAKT